MGCGTSKNKDGVPKDVRRLIPREPPSEAFRIKPVLPEYPPPQPPASRKDEIYDPSENQDIYLHALRAPKDVETSYEELLAYLTNGLRTDMMKLRSIFCWLGTQNIEDENLRNVSESDGEITPRGYKKLIQQRNGSYAGFFTLLCRAAGIPCAFINGISKGLGYEVGDQDIKYLGDKWVAVYIDGWRLIHPLRAFKCVLGYKSGNWTLIESDGKRKRNKEKASEGQEIRTFNEYYFLCDPIEFSMTCLPTDLIWQLNYPANTMSYNKFVNIPFIQEKYFSYGFQICGQLKSMLIAKKGVTSVTLRVPDHKEIQLSYEFFYNHLFDRPDSEDVYALKRYVLMSYDEYSQRWTLEIRVPLPGRYRIAIYGGPSNLSTLPWLCDVGVMSDEHIKRDPYPKNPWIGFGPVDITRKIGMMDPSHKSGIQFILPRQDIHMTFRLEKKLEVKTELIHLKMSSKELINNHSAVINNQSEVHTLHVWVKVPKEGEYALQIFARLKDSKNTFENVCNYYLTTDPPREAGVEMEYKPFDTPLEKKAREALTTAQKYDDLKQAVDKYEQSGLYERKGEYGKAKRKLEYLELAQDLKDAINRRNVDLLVKAIQQAESSPFQQKLVNLVTQARDMLESIRVLNKFAHDVLEMKQSTLAELLSYKSPLQIIYDVLVATLRLLGESLSELKSSWENVRWIMKMQGKGSVMRRIRNFDLNNVSTDMCNDANVILSQYDEETVLAASAAVGTFFRWACSIVKEKQGGIRANT
ncbi:hypothetical protein ACJMK2_042954 [Sinanodonta woodiana]|uniref:Transglutaminase-like domain-containing protein n=1 Tax=Sinanodonta woodiana TaxID=1069815 RepID=A0ABD3VVF7_SINWO